MFSNYGSDAALNSSFTRINCQSYVILNSNLQQHLIIIKCTIKFNWSVTKFFLIGVHCRVKFFIVINYITCHLI